MGVACGTCGEYLFNLGVICAQVLCCQSLVIFELSIFVSFLHFSSGFLHEKEAFEAVLIAF
jgi:hypothetical protein